MQVDLNRPRENHSLFLESRPRPTNDRQDRGGFTLGALVT